MQDQSAVAPAAKTIPVLEIAEFIARSISEDGAAAMIVAKAPSGEQFAVRLPIDGLGALRSVINSLIDAATIRKLEPGSVVFKKPKTFEVGHSDELRGMMVIQFDPRTPDEATFLLRNEDGLSLARGIKADIMPRLSEAERAQAIASESKLVVPTRRQIIVPH